MFNLDRLREIAKREGGTINTTVPLSELIRLMEIEAEYVHLKRKPTVVVAELTSVTDDKSFTNAYLTPSEFIKVGRANEDVVVDGGELKELILSNRKYYDLVIEKTKQIKDLTRKVSELSRDIVECINSPKEVIVQEVPVEVVATKTYPRVYGIDKLLTSIGINLNERT